MSDELPLSPSSSGGPPLDLPLGPAGSTPSPSKEPAREGAGPQRPRRSRPKKASSRPFWLTLAVVVALVAAFFLLRGAPPVMRVAPPLLDFGEQRPGQEAILSLEVRNDGGRKLDVSAVEVDGEAWDELAVVSTTCLEREVPPGESCRVEVRFLAAATGRRKAGVVIQGNASNAPLTVPAVAEAVAPHLALDPLELIFAPQPLGDESEGLTVALSNQGSAPMTVRESALEGSGAGDFRVRSLPCRDREVAPGQVCQVELTFAPTLVGERSATLRVLADGASQSPLVRLSGIGLSPEPELDLGTGEGGTAGGAAGGLDFGPVRVGGEGATRLFRLTNRGGEPFALGAVSLQGEASGFAIGEDRCTSVSLEPGASCTVGLQLVPLQEGEARGELVLSHADGTGETRVPLVGRGVAPRLAVEPGSLDFGEVRLGVAAQPLAVTVTNGGSGFLERLQVGLEGRGAGAFLRGQDSCSGNTLAAGAHCRLEVLFRPVTEGAAATMLRLTSPSDPQGASVSLRGVGAAPHLEVDPHGLRFPEVQQGASRELTVRLSNTGKAPLVLRQLAVEGGDGGDFALTAEDCSQPSGLAPASSCTVSVRFAPRAGDRRERRARLRLEHNASWSPREIVLEGIAGPPPMPQIRVEPREVTFAAQRSGTRSGIVTVRVANPGNAPLHFEAPRVVGRDAGDFLLVAGSCDGVPHLSPGSSCTFGLRFLPGGEGERRAELLVEHDAAGGSLRARLSGIGLSPEPP